MADTKVKVALESEGQLFARYSLNWVLACALANGRRVRMQVDEHTEEEETLTFSVEKRADESYSPKMFVTLPEQDFSGMLESLTVKVHAPSFRGGRFSVELPAVGEAVVFDEIVCGPSEGDRFLLYGAQVACIKGAYAIDSVCAEDEPRYRFAQVAFAPGGEPYDYRCNDEDIAVGDTVFVNTSSRGEVTARVVAIVEKPVTDLPLFLDEYKFVQGKV